MTAPVIPVLTADTATPAWLTHALTILIPLVGALVSILHPNGTLKSPSAQAAVIIGGLVVAGAIHVGHLVTANGVTKAGILKSVTEEEAWVKANAAILRSTFEAAGPALDALPGVPAAIAKIEEAVGQVQARVAQIPADQTQAAILALRNVLGNTGAGAGVTLTGTAAAPPAPSAGQQ